MSGHPPFVLTEKYGWVIPSLNLPTGKIFKIGVIGLVSWYSKAFVRYTEMIRGARVVAAADLGISDDYMTRCIGFPKAQYAREFGVKLYEDPSEMIRNEKLDGVFVCTENSKHATYAEMSIKEGVNVFIAKPFAPTLDDADRIVRAAEGSGSIVTTSNPARYDNMIRQAYEKVNNRAIGKPITMRALINHHTLTHDSPPWCLDYQKEGGPEVVFGFYTADLIRWFLKSEAKRVYSESFNFLHKNVPYADNVKAIVRLENDTMASMDMYLSVEAGWPFPLWEIEVVGTKGCIRTRQDNSAVTLFTNRGLEAYQSYINPVLSSEIAAWLTACVRSAQPEITPKAARAAVEICVACRDSAEKGKVVNLPIKQ